MEVCSGTERICDVNVDTEVQDIPKSLWIAGAIFCHIAPMSMLSLILEFELCVFRAEKMSLFFGFGVAWPTGIAKPTSLTEGLSF
jgi:hypothetical protein